MASVQNLPGVWVALASVDAYSNIRRLHSRPIGVPTPDTTHHSLEVIDGMKVVILIKLVLSMLRDSDAELIEVAMRFDGFNVAHHHIPVTEILAGGGVYPFVTFLDGMTSMAKTAEFRAITTGNLDCLFPMVRLMTDRLQPRVHPEKMRTPFCVRSGSARFRSMFVMRRVSLSKAEAAHSITFATMAAIPATSGIAVVRLTSSSKSQARDIRKRKTKYLFQVRQSSPSRSEHDYCRSQRASWGHWTFYVSLRQQGNTRAA